MAVTTVRALHDNIKKQKEDKKKRRKVRRNTKERKKERKKERMNEGKKERMNDRMIGRKKERKNERKNFSPYDGEDFGHPDDREGHERKKSIVGVEVIQKERNANEEGDKYEGFNHMRNDELNIRNLVTNAILKNKGELQHAYLSLSKCERDDGRGEKEKKKDRREQSETMKNMVQIRKRKSR